MPERHDLISLRRAVEALGRSGGARSERPFRLGEAGIDAALGGGLARGALHEVHAASATGASASGFGLCLALRAAGDRPLVWVRQEIGEAETGALHGEGVAAFGGDPRRLLVVRARGPTDVLRAAAEAARCPVVGAALFEIWGEPKVLDLKASRRLALAGAASGVTLVSVRLAARPVPSAAVTRWSAAAAPSVPLEANAPGRPAFEVRLLRHRGGAPPFTWRLEWDRERASFASSPISRSVAPLPADGAAAEEGAGWRRVG